ncbi:MAG: 4Fe-4S dicluster domain-containing protein [Dehalococcoidia bacterium]|nr:4Fe-4S dicluster domain-containing protein [Dehalococcoidia bacterium]
MAQETKVAEKVRMLDIYIMGKRYQVPEGLTIMTALEYCGYRLIRGCGCRAAFCGACGTVYNFKNDPTLRYALACQKLVEQDMYLTQIPFFPASKPDYDLEKMESTGEQILKIYPELVTCFGCNNCTKSCPQDLEVMEFMSAAIRGDIKEVAIKSFDCLMCGLCAARCPQGLVPYNIALLSRRLYGRYMAPRSKQIGERIAEIKAGKFDAEIEELQKMGIEQLKRRFDGRKIIND